MTSPNPRHVISSSQDRLPELVAALAVTAADIERDLARTTPPGG